MGINKEMILSSVATDLEVSSHRIITGAYGFEAKAAAVDLAEAMNLDDEAALTMVQALSSRIDGLDLRERGDVIEHLYGLVEALGGPAVSQAAQVEVLPSPVVEEIAEPAQEQAVDPEVAAKVSDEIDRSEVIAPVVDAVDATEEPVEPEHSAEDQAPKTDTSAEEQVEEAASPEKSEDTLRHLKILGRVYDPEDLALLNRDEMQLVLEATFDRYRSLKIVRISNEGKEQRVEQIRRFIAGEEFNDMGVDYGVGESAVRLGVAKALAGIVKRTTPEELSDLLQKAVNGEIDFQSSVQEVVEEAEAARQDPETTAESQETHEPETNDEEEIIFEQKNKSEAVMQMLNKLIGDRPDLIEYVSALCAEDPNKLINAFCDVYTGADWLEIEETIRTEDATCLAVHIGRGLSLSVIANSLGVAPEDALKRMSRVITAPIEANYESALLMIQKLVPAPEAAVVSAETEAKVETFEEAFENLLTALRVTGKEQARQIKKILNPKLNEPDKDFALHIHRKSLEAVVNVVTKSGKMPPELEFTKGEWDMLGDVLSTGKPLSVRTAFLRAKDEFNGTNLDHEAAWITIIDKLARGVTATDTKIEV